MQNRQAAWQECGSCRLSHQCRFCLVNPPGVAQDGGVMENSLKDSAAWSATLNGMPREGACAERSRVVDTREVDLFAAMSGDRNPLHFDEDAARQSLFGGLIVQGGVTSGILNALVAEDLPGPGSVFLGVEWKFVKAVYIGDTITGRVEVARVRADKPICELVTTVRNQKGETCLTGTAVSYTVPLRRASP
jgi:acyl dehydratase